MRTIFIATTCLLLACSSPQTTDSSKNVSEVPSSAQKAEDAEQEVSLAGWGTAEVEMLKVIGFRPQFVPESDLIIYTAKNLEGLWCHNPQGGQIRRLTEEKGAGIEPVVFRDRVVYQVKARKKYLEVVDLASGREQALEGNLRHMRPGEYAQRENKGTYVRVSDDLLSLELHSESG
ncbi:MAG: hypothetical protein KI790_06245, partial [Cyclobacteriaceae bacterium]|nr:hypothetical protein [Cyclobacteriaceae bacterium HetDA_MAG_MS6]